MLSYRRPPVALPGAVSCSSAWRKPGRQAVLALPEKKDPAHEGPGEFCLEQDPDHEGPGGLYWEHTTVHGVGVKRAHSGARSGLWVKTGTKPGPKDQLDL